MVTKLLRKLRRFLFGTKYVTSEKTWDSRTHPGGQPPYDVFWDVQGQMNRERAVAEMSKLGKK